MGKRRRKGWMCTMNFCLRQLGTLEFWETLLDSFGNLGPIAPIMLAMVESFFPPLPLIAIVALNVAAHGGILGFLYSWAGVARVAASCSCSGGGWSSASSGSLPPARPSWKRLSSG